MARRRHSASRVLHAGRALWGAYRAMPLAFACRGARFSSTCSPPILERGPWELLRWGRAVDLFRHALFLFVLVPSVFWFPGFSSSQAFLVPRLFWFPGSAWEPNVLQAPPGNLCFWWFLVLQAPPGPRVFSGLRLPSARQSSRAGPVLRVRCVSWEIGLRISIICGGGR
ncbi:MAG: hypothetical protein KatS3mg111_4271 [Pirellulaceae bacterium]|nr:MAG: hypothetical protein KatS3mg111_2104 [Pirellulaceae bacterium]GIX00939.1 MAG: hypothetical protein KatS3mg111_4271 [Pirellulaceae bacterium]